jgi:flavin-dependent dehydrogenase
MEPDRIARLFGVGGDPQQLFEDMWFGWLEYGYAWAFPKHSTVSVGISGLQARTPSIKDAWQSFVDCLAKHYEVTLDVSNKAGYRVPLKGPSRKTLSARIMLVGDAGGFVSPVSGEGIFYCIETGRMAAEVAAEILKGSRGVSTREYERRWRAAFKRDFDAARFFASLSTSSQQSLDRFIQMLATDDKLNGYMQELMDGIRPCRQAAIQILTRMVIRHPLRALKMIT